MSKYGMTREVSYGFEEAIERTKDTLAEHGFGVLSDIDVAAKLRDKLDVNVDDYRILGACSPPHAHQAIEKEQEIGLLLPCNVLVYRDNGTTYVSAIRPSRALSIADNPSLESIASEIETALKTVLDEL